MGFNSGFKGLKSRSLRDTLCPSLPAKLTYTSQQVQLYTYEQVHEA